MDLLRNNKVARITAIWAAVALAAAITLLVTQNSGTPGEPPIKDLGDVGLISGESVTIAYNGGGDNFTGSISDDNPACLSNRQVGVFLDNAGSVPDVFVQGDVTDGTGQYSTTGLPTTPGNYYARVLETFFPTACGPSTSATIPVP
jgi:hypothetical protein